MNSHDAVADDLCSDLFHKFPYPLPFNPFRGRGNFFSTRYRVMACLVEQRQLPSILPPAGNNIIDR
jgi:hypothetical protein